MTKFPKFSRTLIQLQNEVDRLEKTLKECIRSKKQQMISQRPTSTKPNELQQQQTPIAIVGMASIFPRSRTLQEYWETIIRKTDCISDVPPSRWSIEDYYDPNPLTPDKTYCKRGGFIPEIDFNPLEFGIPPNQLEVTDISQLLGLVVAKAALADAGYEEKPFNRERTGVILGVALARQLSMPLGARLQYPIWKKVLKSSGLSEADTEAIIAKMKRAYVDWEPNAFPGMLANIVSGRIANRFDLGGMNCVVDAACASALGALSMAIAELSSGRADMMLTGGVDPDNTAFAYLCFSKTPAVSPGEKVKPFDAESDGMMLGEGVGMLVLKRLEDAERDRDRIYAVIKGMGTSSDGRHKSIYAPRAEGQMRALRRAYEAAGFTPDTVGVIEAHGTGTMAGDPAEFAALKAVFSEYNPSPQQIALGSVKSQIGHTKAAAGAASLIKTALALHHKVIPPTINVSQPHPKLGIEESPFYLNTETRPWLPTTAPRRAGVSSFGFGGTNYHVVLEEYQPEHYSAYRLHQTPHPILLAAETVTELTTKAQVLLEQLQGEKGELCFRDLIEPGQAQEIPSSSARLGFVAVSAAETAQKLQQGLHTLQKQPQAQQWEHPYGIFYRQTGLETAGKVVALFSGQGSQYLDMGKELVMNFPSLRQTYQHIDQLLSESGLPPVSPRVFPPPVFAPEQRQQQAQVLQQTEVAQSAIAAFSVGLYKLLQAAGFQPDFVAGHSFGELTALWAAGVISEADYFALVKARGQAMATPSHEAGAMLAVKGDGVQVRSALAAFKQIAIANWNAPQQVVLAGDKTEMIQVQTHLEQQGYTTTLLPVAAAFHTAKVGHAQKPFAKAIEAVTFNPPQIPVYTNTSGNPYPQEAKASKKILQQHLLSQVLFQQEIENIYAAGGTCFVEFGPRRILTNLVSEILGERPHLAVALNGSRQKDSDRQLREAVVQLRVAGLSLTHLDSYQILPSLPPEKHPLSIRLESVNYVSDQTKQAFEAALQDHQIALTSSTPVTEATVTPTAKQNGYSQELATMTEHNMFAAKTTTPSPKVPPTQIPLERILTSLEQNLTQFHQHQQETLDLHRQYLQYQSQYTHTIFQLMQQHNQLWTTVQTTPQEVQVKTAVLESAERSLIQFQEHQADILRVHEQYLNHQADYTKNFFLLTQQGYARFLQGDGQWEEMTTPEQATAMTLVESDLPATEELSLIKTRNGNGNGHHPQIATRGTITPQENGHHPPPQASQSVALTATTTRDHGHSPQTQELQLVTPPSKPPAPIVTPTSALAEIDLSNLSDTLLTVVSDKTGYPVEMLEVDMDLEADLGIDSIKRVEILGALQEQVPDLPQPNLEDLAELRTLAQISEYLQSFGQQIAAGEGLVTALEEAPADPPQLNGSVSIEATLLTIVSEKTGYPQESLNLDMHLETDLGIDRVKRREIWNALQAKLPALLQPQGNSTDLNELTTLGQVLAYLHPDPTQKKTYITLNAS